MFYYIKSISFLVDGGHESRKRPWHPLCDGGALSQKGGESPQRSLHTLIGCSTIHSTTCISNNSMRLHSSPDFVLRDPDGSFQLHDSTMWYRTHDSMHTFTSGLRHLTTQPGGGVVVPSCGELLGWDLDLRGPALPPFYRVLNLSRCWSLAHSTRALNQPSVIPY